jgi:hypothetical protein
MFRIVLGHGVRRAAGIEEADDAVAAGDQRIGVEHRRTADTPNAAYTADAPDSSDTAYAPDTAYAANTTYSAYATPVAVPLLAGFLSVPPA